MIPGMNFEVRKFFHWDHTVNYFFDYFLIKAKGFIVRQFFSLNVKKSNWFYFSLLQWHDLVNLGLNYYIY